MYYLYLGFGGVVILKLKTLKWLNQGNLRTLSKGKFIWALGFRVKGFGFSKIRGTFLWSLKDYIVCCIFGSRDLGKLPFAARYQVQKQHAVHKLVEGRRFLQAVQRNLIILRV